MPKKTDIKFYFLILGGSIMILILALVFFYKPIYLYRPAHRFWLSHLHRTLTINDTNSIRSWMTFDYINKAFKLPVDYLKNTLNISDSRYPNIALEDYAEKEKINKASFTTNVQEAVHNYLTSLK